MKHKIKIDRSLGHIGWLEYDIDGEIKLSTQCWWDNSNRVKVGTYAGAATRMHKRDDGSDGGKREAILIHRKDAPRRDHKLPRHPSGNASEIFIHKDLGLKERASDGCIVCGSNSVLKIWNAVHPKDVYSIEVVINDVSG